MKSRIKNNTLRETEDNPLLEQFPLSDSRLTRLRTLDCQGIIRVTRKMAATDIHPRRYSATTFFKIPQLIKHPPVLGLPCVFQAFKTRQAQNDPLIIDSSFIKISVQNPDEPFERGDHVASKTFFLTVSTGIVSPVHSSKAAAP